MRLLAILTILNGLAYIGYGITIFSDVVEYIDGSEDWYLVVYLALYFLGGICCILFGFRTQGWHHLDNANESGELLDLAWNDTGEILRVEGPLRVAQVAGLVCVTLVSMWILFLAPQSAFAGPEDPGFGFFGVVLREVVSICALIYLFRKLNLKKVKPDGDGEVEA